MDIYAYWKQCFVKNGPLSFTKLLPPFTIPSTLHSKLHCNKDLGGKDAFEVVELEMWSAVVKTRIK